MSCNEGRSRGVPLPDCLNPFHLSSQNDPLSPPSDLKEGPQEDAKTRKKNRKKTRNKKDRSPKSILLDPNESLFESSSGTGAESRERGRYAVPLEAVVDETAGMTRALSESALRRKSIASESRALDDGLKNDKMYPLSPARMQKRHLEHRFEKYLSKSTSDLQREPQRRKSCSSATRAKLLELIPDSGSSVSQTSQKETPEKEPSPDEVTLGGLGGSGHTESSSLKTKRKRAKSRRRKSQSSTSSHKVSSNGAIQDSSRGTDCSEQSSEQRSLSQLEIMGPDSIGNLIRNSQGQDASSRGQDTKSSVVSDETHISGIELVVSATENGDVEHTTANTSEENSQAPAAINGKSKGQEEESVSSSVREEMKLRELRRRFACFVCSTVVIVLVSITVVLILMSITWKGYGVPFQRGRRLLRFRQV